MFKRPLAAVAIAFVTALTILGTANAAAAADASVGVFDINGAQAGTIKHRDDGDMFWVKDTHADGHGVRGNLLDANGNVLDTVYNGYGAAGGYATFAYNVVAGRKYYIQVCIRDGAGDVTGRCNEKAIWE